MSEYFTFKAEVYRVRGTADTQLQTFRFDDSLNLILADIMTSARPVASLIPTPLFTEGRKLTPEGLCKRIQSACILQLLLVEIAVHVYIQRSVSGRSTAVERKSR